MILQQIERRYAEMYEDAPYCTKLKIVASIATCLSLALLILTGISIVYHRMDHILQQHIRIVPLVSVFETKTSCIYNTQYCQIFNDCALRKATEICVEQLRDSTQAVSCRISTECNKYDSIKHSLYIGIITISGVFAALIIVYIILRWRSNEPHTLA